MGKWSPHTPFKHRTYTGRGAPLPSSLMERFTSRIEWTGGHWFYVSPTGKQKDLYPTIAWGQDGIRYRLKTHMLAARIWLLDHGPLPEHGVVHHRGGVTACCRPEHLDVVSRGSHISWHSFVEKESQALLEFEIARLRERGGGGSVSTNPCLKIRIGRQGPWMDVESIFVREPGQNVAVMVQAGDVSELRRTMLMVEGVKLPEQEKHLVEISGQLELL